MKKAKRENYLYRQKHERDLFEIRRWIPNKDRDLVHDVCTKLRKDKSKAIRKRVREAME